MDLEALKAKLSATRAVDVRGKVLSVTGLAVRFALPGARVGDVVTIRRRGEPLACEVVGFSQGEAVGMPLGALEGVGPDDAVEPLASGFFVPVSDALLGRVLDGLGRPIDAGPSLEGGRPVPTTRAAPRALERRPIRDVLPTGVRVVDALLTLGEGQRIGVFAGSGVGKTSLLSAMARGTRADVVVVALVGERGREVLELLETLGDEARKKTIVVAATSDVPALERLRAAEVATAYAEHFRDEGKRVLLVVDSVTRYARAAREVGLAAGEPPARRGYPPSVFALLPKLLERAGQGSTGSITGVYTVLVEGGDMEEPIADEVRGILDGHVVLDRTLAARGRFPAIDPLVSLSRVMDGVVSPEHRDAARKIRELVALYEQKRDLVTLGAYKKGSDPKLDVALAKIDAIELLLRQRRDEVAPFEKTVAELVRLSR